MFYTYPKCEKKIHEYLLKNNFESWLPLIWVERKWSDRMKKMNLPMFPNYIFVKIEQNYIYKILETKRIVNCLKYNGKPAYIREDEVDKIKKISENNCCLEVETDLNIGDSVIIKEGPLAGLEGVLIERKGIQRLSVRIESLYQSIILNIERSNIKKNMLSYI